MVDLPEQLRLFVSELDASQERVAVLQLDGEGGVIGFEGDLSVFGLEDININDSVSDFGLYIEELFPQYERPFKVLDLEIQSGRYSTIYIQSINDIHWVILLDRTLEAVEELMLRQKTNMESLKGAL